MTLKKLGENPFWYYAQLQAVDKNQNLIVLFYILWVFAVITTIQLSSILYIERNLGCIFFCNAYN